MPKSNLRRERARGEEEEEKRRGEEEEGSGGVGEREEAV